MLHTDKSIDIGNRVRHLFAVLRLRSSNTAVEDSRSQERYRRVILTGLTSIAARGTTAITALISIPLTVNYLGTERYGLWMTISSVIAMLSFADLGLGNGLLNAVSEAHGTNDRAAARRYVSSAFFLLSAIAVILVIIFASVYSWIPWKQAFNLSSSAAVEEAGPAVAVFIACFAVSMPLGIVQRVQLGYQEGFTSNLWLASGSLLGLLGLLLAVRLEGGLPWLVLAMSGAPVFATLLSYLAEFLHTRPWLLPSIKFCRWEPCRKIMGTGFMFFALQIAVGLAYASDNVILAQSLGTSAVATYAVVQRLFSIGPMLQGMFVTPLWPAYGEAASRSDVSWIRQALVRSLIASLVVCTVISSVLLLFSAQIVSTWVGPQITPALPLLLGFAVWTLLSAYGNVAATFLNGIGLLSFQVRYALLFGVAAIGLKLIAVGQGGEAGVIWATVVAYIPFTLIPTAVMIRRVLRNRHGNWTAISGHVVSTSP